MKFLSEESDSHEINIEVASSVAVASNAYTNPLRRNGVNFDKGPYLANGEFDGQKSHGVAHPKKDGSISMSEQAFNLPSDVDADAEIELLARETHISREQVKIVYSSERAKLERTARIKTYIPVLVHRRVKALLRRRA